jgi:hypothetical protein
MSADLVKKQPSLFLLIDQSIKIPRTTENVPEAAWRLGFRCFADESSGGGDSQDGRVV